MLCVLSRSGYTEKTYLAIITGQKATRALHWMDDHPDAQPLVHLPDVPTINCHHDTPFRFKDVTWTYSTVTLSKVPRRYDWNPNTATMLPPVPRQPVKYVDLTTRALPAYACVGLDADLTPLLVRTTPMIVEREGITFAAQIFKLINFNAANLPPNNPFYQPPPPGNDDSRGDYRQPPPHGGSSSGAAGLGVAGPSGLVM